MQSEIVGVAIHVVLAADERRAGNEGLVKLIGILIPRGIACTRRVSSTPENAPTHPRNSPVGSGSLVTKFMMSAEVQFFRSCVCSTKLLESSPALSLYSIPTAIMHSNLRPNGAPGTDFVNDNGVEAMTNNRRQAACSLRSREAVRKVSIDWVEMSWSFSGGESSLRAGG